MKKKKLIIGITIVAFIVVMISVGSLIAIEQHNKKVVRQEAKEGKIVESTTMEVEKEEIVTEESKKGEESFDYEYNKPKYTNIVQFFYMDKRKIDTVNEVNYDKEKITTLLEKYGINANFECKNSNLDSTITDTHKKLIAMGNLDFNTLEMKACEEVFEGYEVDKKHYNYPTYIGKTGICPLGGATYIIPYNTVNQIYKDLYEKDMSKENIDGSIINKVKNPSFDYISSKDIFAITKNTNSGGCGKTTFIYIIKSVTEENNKLNVELYYTKSLETKTDKYDEIIKFKNFEITKTDNWETNVHTDIYQEIKDKYIDQLDVYDIEFIKKNDNYILNNIKKIKEA